MTIHTTLLIIEPKELVRKGIIACLKAHFENAQFLECTSVKDAEILVQQHTIDIVLSEIELDNSNGFELFHNKAFSSLKVILLTNLVKKEYIITAKHFGASGYFSKNISPELLAENIRRALITNMFTSNDWFSIDHKENTAFILRTIELLNTLSKQEKKALELFCRNYNTQEVSEEMHVQRKSVDNYKNRIAKKMELPTELFFRDWIRNQGTFLSLLLKLNESRKNN